MHNILELAYNLLDEKKQRLISRLSAFRNPMDYDATSIFNDFGDEEKFNDVLIELVDRGMLFRDEKSNKFDLHPIVRKYSYDRLMDKEGVHSKLKDYFDTIPKQEKIDSMGDFTLYIEAYHHTVRAGEYDKAVELFKDRLHHELYFKFGAYLTIIELLRASFLEGEDTLPRLKKENAQAWTTSVLASSYLLSGQLRRAMSLIEVGNKLLKSEDDKVNLAINLSNLAISQMRVGELDNAEFNCKRSVEIFRELNEEFREAVGHQELGLLLVYRGNFDESRKELISALKVFTKLKASRSQCMLCVYLTLRSLTMSNAEESIKSAKKARELADVRHYESDIIFAEYLLGAAHLMKGNLAEAEKHLTEALMRDRKINLVELEPDILFEFAKLRFRQNHKEEVLKFAEEALQIADRCEYRLKQADIHNFLAEYYLAAGDLEKAKKHGEIANERAECGYKPALEKAEKLLNEIERRWK